MGAARCWISATSSVACRAAARSARSASSRSASGYQWLDRPPKDKSGSPGTSVRSQPSSPPSPATPGDRPPKAKSESPGATRPTSQRSRLNRVVCQAGSWLRSGCWPPSWRWLVGWPCWPPDGQAAGLGSNTRPDHGHRPATLDGAAAPTRQPHHQPNCSSPDRITDDHGHQTTPQSPRPPPRAPPGQAVPLRHRTCLGAPRPRATARSLALNRQIDHLSGQGRTKRQAPGRPST